MGMLAMRSKREIQNRLATTNDSFTIEVLRWVLDGGCEMCEHKDCREMEKKCIRVKHYLVILRLNITGRTV